MCYFDRLNQELRMNSLKNLKIKSCYKLGIYSFIIDIFIQNLVKVIPDNKSTHK